MKVRAINKLAYDSTINEIDRFIQKLAKHQDIDDIVKIADELQNLKYCIINTSFDTDVNS